MRCILALIRFVAPVVLLFLSLSARAAAVYVETVTSTSPTAARSNALSASQGVTIQCDAAAYILFGGSTVTVTSSTGLKLTADTPWPDVTVFGFNYLSVLAVSGTANCKIFTYVY